MPVFTLGRLAKSAITFSLAATLLGCVFVSGWSSGAEEKPQLPPGPGITLYAAGDIADCRNLPAAASGAARTAGLISKDMVGHPDSAVLVLGDATYPVGLPAEFSDCYTPTWGRFKSRTHPAPGNHEYNTPTAFGYYEYFGGAAGPERRGYYSFDLGAWHMISLNSNMKPADLPAQWKWLKADLEAHRARCTLAYWHHPYFSSGGHGNNDFMRAAWEILQAAGADVVLSGHDHDYERFGPQDADGMRDDKHGIRQFVVGTGGAKLTPFLIRKGNSEAADNAAHGVLRMTLKHEGYEWEFLPDGGAFSDKGAALCH